MSILIPICHLYVLSGIISDGMPIQLIMAYAIGNGAGAFVVMWWFEEKENKEENGTE